MSGKFRKENSLRQYADELVYGVNYEILYEILYEYRVGLQRTNPTLQRIQPILHGI